MNYPEEEKLIRLYLLGVGSDDQQRHVEERLLGDSDYCDQLVIIEEELIDDYLLGVLPDQERNRFESHFLTTPKRKQNLALARDLKKHASNMAPPIQKAITPAAQSTGWWQTLFFPRWKPAAFATVLLAAAVGVWQFYSRQSPVEDALASLNLAYRERRPVVSRIIGFGYAPSPITSEQRGGRVEKIEEKVDYIALERAQTLLFSPNANRLSPILLHARGKYFLARKEFDKAIDQLSLAVKSEPANALIHSDLGAALLGKIEQDRLTAAGRLDQDLNECFIHLNKALELDPSLPEPLFNRALLNQREQLPRQAREDWEKYLRKDPASPWAEEARQNLKAIEEELKKVSLQKEQLYQNFLDSWQRGDKRQAMEAFNSSYSFLFHPNDGNYILEKQVDGFLQAKLCGGTKLAGKRLETLTGLGTIVERQTKDRFINDLVRYYGRAGPDQLLQIKQARELMTDARALSFGARNDQAIEKFKQAQMLFEQAGNIGSAVIATAWIGFCHHQRSDTVSNLKVFAQLVPELGNRNYRWLQANALCGLANGHNSSGMFSRAIDDCNRCGEMSAATGDQLGALRARSMLGNIYYVLGKHKENLRLSLQGRTRSVELGADPRLIISFYNLHAWSLSAIALHESALAFQKEAVKIADETSIPRLITYARIFQGLVYAKDRKFNQAIESVMAGIAIGKRLQDEKTGQDFVHKGLLRLGHIYREAGRFGEALNAYNQVINFFSQGKNEAYFYGASKGRLMTLIAQGADEAARVEIENVIALYEKYRKSIQEESNRNSFFDQEQNIYDIAVDFAYAKLNDPQMAFEYSERCRARSLLDESSRRYKVVAGIEAPEVQIDGVTDPAGAEEIQQRMPKDAQLVEYAVLNNKLIIWLVSNRGIESLPVKITREELTERVNGYLALISQPPGKSDEKWKAAAADLYDILVKPVVVRLDRNKQICIVPDKLLARLPFGALVSHQSGRLFIEDYSLISASSANMFLSLTKKAQEKSGVKSERLLAVGNPRFDRGSFPHLLNLPTAEREASEIAGYYHSSLVLTGAQATKSAVLREVKRADVVHLAMHYVTDSDSAMFSKLPFADTPAEEREDVLCLYEIYRINSPSPRLVVLSACQTKAEEYFAGEGAIGISRPWEAAGVPLVVASLWPVDTYATTELMTEFHRKRREARLSTAEAIRSAQSRLIHSTNYSHPYYWAAFTLTGGYSEF